MKVTRGSLRAAGACWFRDITKTARLEALVPPAGLYVSEAAVQAALDAGVSPGSVHWVLCYAAGAQEKALRDHAFWCSGRVSSGHPVNVAAGAAHDRASLAGWEAAQGLRGLADHVARTSAERESWTEACFDLARRIARCP